MMPGKTGFDVCQEVRADESLAGDEDRAAHRQGPRHRRRQGHRARRRRLRHQAVLDPRAGGARARDARPMKVDRREIAAALLPGALFAVAASGRCSARVALTLRRARARGARRRCSRRAPRCWRSALLLAALALGHARPPRLAALRGGAGAAGRGGAGRRRRRRRAAAGARRARPARAPSRWPSTACVRQRAALRDEMAQKVREASRDIEQERSRLAALMSELTQSVVVCNLDGRVLLYNQRARLQFRALSDAPAPAGGAELIGIGRSIYARARPPARRPRAGERAAAAAPRRRRALGAVRHRTPAAASCCACRWRRCAPSAPTAHPPGTRPPRSAASC